MVRAINAPQALLGPEMAVSWGMEQIVRRMRELKVLWVYLSDDRAKMFDWTCEMSPDFCVSKLPKLKRWLAKFPDTESVLVQS